MDTSRTVSIKAGHVKLEGLLSIPKAATGLVVFVHGSGSSRLSVRNQYAAKLMNQAGLATLLFDLLTPQENQVDEITREYRFNIELLSQRTISTIDWISEHTQLQKLSIGLFGASTGAAAALYAAKARPNEVECVVSRGGRPDLAMPALPEVLAPTLLIVGGLDIEVLQLNQQALQAMEIMKTECDLLVVDGATHLFEESDTLQTAAEAAKQWFLRHL